jgi:LmbE family N-acetylglucosaminyl deacetylase
LATVLFVSPHQDDDALAMGPAIRDHLNAGHDVHVLLLTTGQNSGVRAELGMDVPTFVAARDDELSRATRQNGVRAANVHIPANRPQDGQLTQDQAEQMITDFYTAHPGAWCKSYSNLAATGRHVDHVTSGKAVVALAATGLITNLRLYVEPWLLSAFTTAHPGVQVNPEKVTDNTSVLRAFDEYQRQDHIAGMYGVGHLSVGAEFDEARPAPVSQVHVPT